MIKLLYGDAYCCDTYIKDVKHGLAMLEINYLESDVFSNDEKSFCCSMPFMDEKKLFVLNIKDCKKSIGDFIGFIDVCPQYTDIIIKADKIDKRTELYKALNKRKMIMEFTKKSLNDVYDIFVERLCSEWNFNEAAVCEYKDILCDKLNGYLVDEKYDLYRVIKYADLIGSTGEISKSLIDYYMQETVTQKIYEISNYILSGKTSKAIVLAKELLDKGDSAIGIFSLILSQIRICYKASLLSGNHNVYKELGIKSFQLYKNYDKYSTEQYARVYNILQNSVNYCKSGKEPLLCVVECFQDIGKVLS